MSTPLNQVGPNQFATPDLRTVVTLMPSNFGLMAWQVRSDTHPTRWFWSLDVARRFAARTAA